MEANKKRKHTETLNNFVSKVLGGRFNSGGSTQQQVSSQMKFVDIVLIPSPPTAIRFST
jgi:hypothetical protein